MPDAAATSVMAVMTMRSRRKVAPPSKLATLSLKAICSSRPNVAAVYPLSVIAAFIPAAIGGSGGGGGGGDGGAGAGGLMRVSIEYLYMLKMKPAGAAASSAMILGSLVSHVCEQ